LSPGGAALKEMIMGGGEAAVFAAAHATANAVKACGTIVHVQPDEFLKILSFQDNPLIVRASGGLLSRSFRYLTSYKGLAFFCKSGSELILPGQSQLILAKKISIPDL
jgi:hypothetical protein